MTQHRYVVSGWGVGEVWAEDGVLLLHDLAGTVPGLELDSGTPAERPHRPCPRRPSPGATRRSPPRGARAPLPAR